VSKMLSVLFGMPLAEATFARRGFRSGDDGQRLRLERAGQTFLAGYNLALENSPAGSLKMRLDTFESDRGFAYEGAAMAMSLLDGLLGGQRWRAFAETAPEHIYMLHVGAGWAVARLPWRRRLLGRFLNRFDPALRGLVVDGFGFHEGYFNPRKVVGEASSPRLASIVIRGAFDAGLGRAIWFVECGDMRRVVARLRTFPPGRQPDLWAGIGLAVAYAGAAGDGPLDWLRAQAGASAGGLAQGAAFAAKARLLAGVPTEHTDRACEILCGCSSRAAASLCDQVREEMIREGTQNYQLWREKLAQRLSGFAVSSAQLRTSS
jgi:hypothetical protein